MSMEDSQNMFFATFHHILFLKGPEKFGGPVRKDLNLLGPLVHYIAGLLCNDFGHTYRFILLHLSDVTLLQISLDRS